MDHPQWIDGHRVEGVLGHGGMGWVYRVESPTGGGEVALKLLRVVTGTTQLDRLRFEREFKLVSRLEHPCLVPVYALGEHEGQPYYTMEYIVGQNLRDFLSAERERVDRKSWLNLLGSIIGQLLDGLDFIHAHNIVHRDLKPENLLVDTEGTPRLLDFGLARGGSWSFDESQERRLTDPGMVIGTVHYMSPEQIAGAELDARTDLYSLGVIIYELLNGKLPFSGPDPVSVLYQIMHVSAPPMKEAGPLPAGLEKLVLALLAKEPSERPLTASQVRREWSALLGGQQPVEAAVSAAAEAAPARDLYAARLMGRETVLAALEQRIREVSAGQGSLTLITGPGGVGKSRLLQEACGLARAMGVSVCTGSAAEVGGGLPYQLWIRSLRWASRAGLPEPLQPFRRALAALLPDLGPGPDEDESAEPLQKYHLFEGMLRLLRSAAGRGLLVAVEDLHWADVASLEFLHYLARSLEGGEEGSSVPIAVVASVLQEGQEGTLPQLARLSGVYSLELEPLNFAQTEALVRSMLGSGSIDPDSAERLYHETEGNPLFVTEILRTFLAEGRLKRVEGVWLLDAAGVTRTSSGGSRVPRTIREAVLRRLAGLSEQQREILQIAATCGHVLDFEVLSRACGIAEFELLEHLCALTARRILTEDRHFRFANHAVSEVIMESVTPEQRKGLHGRVARAIEAAYPDRRVRELAYHYQLSGDPESSVAHLLEAAARARQSCAFDDAVDLYRRALQFQEACRLVPLYQLEEWLADCIYCTGEPDAALERYTWLLEDARQPLDQARMLRKMGTCWERLGNLSEANRCLEQALEALNLSFLSADEQTSVSSLKLLVRGLVNRKEFKDTARAREIHRICERIGRVLYMLRPKDWFFSFTRLLMVQVTVASALQKGERSTVESWAQAYLYGGYFSLRRLRWSKGARMALHKAAEIAYTAGDGPSKAAILRDTGYLLLLSGDPRRARQLCEDGAALSLNLGDLHGLAQNHLQLNAIYFHLGMLTEAVEQGVRALETAERTSSLLDQAMAAVNLAKAEAVRGCHEQARDYLDAAQELRERYKAPYVDMLFGLAHAYLTMEEGEYATAIGLAANKLARCEALREVDHFRLEFSQLVLSAELELLSEGAEQLTQVAQRLAKAQSLAKGQSIYELSLKRLQARLLHLQGRRNLAVDMLVECVQTAEQLGHPLERARAHLFLSRLLAEEGLGHHHLGQALQAFQEAGVVHPPIRERAALPAPEGQPSG